MACPDMEIAPHLLKPVYVNLFEALMTAQIDEETRVYAKDLDGCYIYANHSFARDSGLPTEMLLGSTVRETCFELDAAEIEEIDKKVVETGTDQFRKVMLHTKRRRIMVYMRKCAIYDERMNCIGVAGLYYPVDRLERTPICARCVTTKGSVERALDVALAMMPPDLLRRYEERMAKDDESDEPTLFGAQES